MSTEHNWAGSYRYRAEAVHRPATVEQVSEIVADAGRVGMLGSRHSFTDIADSDAAAIAPLYPRLPDFARLVERLDPRCAFRNAWLIRHVLGSG